jgi:two-component system chemotaxis response regulator CheY
MNDTARPEPRVLVIDDSQVARQVLAMTCRQVPALLYAKIEEAPDGQAGLERLQAGRYDLVLADVRMPRLDGLELVRRVRGELGDKQTPIVLITTLGTDEDVQRGLAAGATAYLVKPLSPYRIRILIERLLAERASARRRESSLS